MKNIQTILIGIVALGVFYACETETAEALRGGEQLLRDCRPKLLVSTHGKPVRAECETLLTSFGYRVESRRSMLIATAEEQRVRAAG